MPISLRPEETSSTWTLRPSRGKYPWFERQLSAGQGLREAFGGAGAYSPLLRVVAGGVSVFSGEAIVVINWECGG